MHLQGNQIRKDSKTLIFFFFFRILYLQHNAAKASKTTKDISAAKEMSYSQSWGSEHRSM